MSSVRQARESADPTGAPKRTAIVVPILALSLLFLAALGYPAMRAIYADELPSVETTEIEQTAPSEDAIVLDPAEVVRDIPVLADALDNARQTGHLTLVDHEASTEIQEWFRNRYGSDLNESTVLWKGAYFTIRTATF